MPSTLHDGPLWLVRGEPLLAAALLAGTNVAVPENADASLEAADLSATAPVQHLADAVVVLRGKAGTLAVVIESQTAKDDDKRWAWPAYLAEARTQHHCPAALVVICADPETGKWARQPIETGHPGFVLMPIVRDAESTPDPGEPGLQYAAAELAVLNAVTGATDLDTDAGRRLVLTAMAAARLPAERLEIYTHLIRAVASPQARRELEAQMTMTIKDDFIERFKAQGLAEGRDQGLAEGRDQGLAEGRDQGLAEGRAQGEAAMLLRILAARGFAIPEPIRERVLACSDTGQLEAWADKAVAAATLDEVFTG